MERGFVQEHLGCIMQIQLLHEEQNQTRVFMQCGSAKLRGINHRSLIEILFSTSYMAVIALGTIAILGYGGHQVFAGALTIGGLVAFYSYMARLFDPLHAAVEIYSRLNRLSTSVRRILEVIEMTPSVTEKPAALPLPSPSRGYVELRAVPFPYPDRQP